MDKHFFGLLKLKVTMYTFQCEYCGVDFTRNRSRKTRFCSRSCAAFGSRQKRLQTIVTKHSYDLSLTDEFCYFLGLLWADGYINDTPRITLEIKADDMNSVVVPSGFSRYDRQRMHRQPVSTLYSGNRVLFDFVKRCGYLEKHQPSDDLTSNFYWWLGFIDGDGCWYFNSKTKLGQLILTSHYGQDWEFAQQFLCKYGWSCKVYQKESNRGHKYSQLAVLRQQDLCDFGKVLYRDYATKHIGFPRKYHKWTEIVENNSMSLR
jgi:hypothetical protein